MYTRHRPFTRLALFLSALILTACGGGGGGGGNSNINVPTGGVSITTGNAKPISAEVFYSIDTVQGATLGASMLTGVSVQNTTNEFNYPDLILQQLNNALANSTLFGSGATGVAISGTIPCTQGQVSISGDMANPNTSSLTVGDTINLSFSNCTEIGVTLNGTMAMTITNVGTGFELFQLPPYTLGIDVVVNNFSVSEGGMTVTGNGDIAMLISEGASGGSSLVLSGNSLSASSGSQGEILTNYLYDIQYTATDDFTVSLDGTIASTLINGSVSYTTITPFTGNDKLYAGYPTAGEVHVTTSIDSSQAWITALSDGSTVQIDIDTDGDSTVDDTVMTTWTELESL